MLQPLLLSALVTFVSPWFYGRDEPDRWTVGGVFPLPQQIIYGKGNRTLHPLRVGFDLLDKSSCDVLKFNAENYLNRWMFPFPVTPKGASEDYVISVKVRKPCPAGVPEHDFNETYKLRVSMANASIRAETVWGAVRAMETLSQLIFFDINTKKYKIRTVEIVDAPRYPVRGVMIDSSRHYLNVAVIKRQIDLMAMNKMNLLHWHMVDDEAFPFESKKFPELSKVGAYSPRHVYTREQVKEVISYGRLRAIRVMPEFDVPGHTGSWRGQPGLLSNCTDDEGKPTYPTLIDPTNDGNYDFLEILLNEIGDVFPEEFLHLGGDEVIDYVTSCWKHNPKIQEFMKEKGFETEVDLENYFFTNLNEVVEKLKKRRTTVFWQELFDNNRMALNNNSIIQIWKGDTLEAIAENVQNVTAGGHRAIISACWYLNYIKYGIDWHYFYDCDPRNFTAPEEQKNLVLGGIVAIWGEFVDNTNIESRLWPRASAAAERLWSPLEKTQNAKDAWPRLHELRCRLVSRGFRVQPTNYPDYCPFEFDQDHS